MRLEQLRNWLYHHKVRIYEDGGKLLRHYDDPALKAEETDEIRAALARHKESLRVLVRNQCPVCRWPLKAEQDETWRHDYCPRDIMHFTSGFSYDGKFTCGVS